MAAAADAALPGGARAMVGFNYRRVPALALARRLVEQGRIGTLRHVRAVYLQDWLVDPDAPMTWRMQAEQRRVRRARRPRRAHRRPGPLPDRRRDHRRVARSARPSSGERPAAPDGAGQPGTVTVDDAVVFTARLGSGALASFEATRYATGRKNGLRIELNGSAGSLAFDLERLNELEFFDATDRRRLPRVPPDPRHRAAAIPTCPAGGRPGTPSAGSTRSPTRPGTC